MGYMVGQNMLLVLGLLLGGAFVTYLCGRITRPALGEAGSGKLAGAASAVILASALWLFWPLARAVWWRGDLPFTFLGGAKSPFSVQLQADGFSILMSLVVLALAFVVAVYSIGYMNRDRGVEKYHALLLLMVAGMVGLTFTTDLFNLYVFFELMAVASYVLVAFRHDTWEPVEAAFKYLVMSATGSALALLGIAIIFTYTGQLSFPEVFKALENMSPVVGMLAAGLIIVGFGVKAAIVPLHTWLPDAHAAAPSGISAMLSGVVIQSGLFAMMRVLLGVFGPATIPLGLVLALFAVLTMTIGNLAALAQTDLKRMLAFSSIAQMGYILLGLGLGIWWCPRAIAGLSGGVFHIMTHAFMKGLAFLCAGVIVHQLGTRDIASMRGLGHRMPFVAICFAVAGLGLAGVPPLSGFMSKWLIYKAGIDIGSWYGYTFTIIAVANSVLSLGYYLPVIGAFWARERAPGVDRMREASPLCAVPIGALALVTLVLGLYPQAGITAVRPAIEYLLRALGGM